MVGFGPGSRNWKIGTIYQRMNGLMKSGALGPNDKPLWFDVWKAFPPVSRPRYDRHVQEKEIPIILYPEDIVRAKYDKTFLGQLATIKHENPQKVIKKQVFVNEYIKQQHQHKTVDDVVAATVKALQLRDIYFTTKDSKKGEYIPHEADLDADSEFKTTKTEPRPARSVAFPLDFSDVLKGMEKPSSLADKVEVKPLLKKDTKETVEAETMEEVKPVFKAETIEEVKAETIEGVKEVKRAINTDEDFDAVIEDLIEKPGSGQIKLDDFYGEASADFDFEEDQETEGKEGKNKR